MIFAEQIRSARALLNWSQAKLALVSRLGVMTIKRLEAGTGPVRGTANSIWAIEKALEDAGIIFIAEDDLMGPGVRLKGKVGRSPDTEGTNT